jgi:hypothetical protein
MRSATTLFGARSLPWAVKFALEILRMVGTDLRRFMEIDVNFCFVDGTLAWSFSPVR